MLHNDPHASNCLFSEHGIRLNSEVVALFQRINLIYFRKYVDHVSIWLIG